MSQRYDIENFEVGCYAKNVPTGEPVRLISRYKSDDLNDAIWIVEDLEGNLRLEYEYNLEDPYEWR